MPCPDLVAIAGGASDQPAKAVRHTGDLAMSRHDDEETAGFHRHAPHMGAPAGEPLGDYCPDQVSRLKPKIAFMAPAMADREPQFIDVAQPSMPTPRRVHEQGHDARRTQMLRGGCSHGGRVEPMRLREGKPRTVIFRPPSRASLHG